MRFSSYARQTDKQTSRHTHHSTSQNDDDTDRGCGDTLSVSIYSGVGEAADNTVDGCEVWTSLSGRDSRGPVVVVVDVVVVVVVLSDRRLVNALSLIAGDCTHTHTHTHVHSFIFI